MSTCTNVDEIYLDSFATVLAKEVRHIAWPVPFIDDSPSAGFCRR